MGRPKALLPVDGETMLARMVRIVRAVTDPIVVVAAPGQTLPELANVSVVHDSVAGRGPLEGLAVGLEALRSRTQWAWVVATDMPALSPAILSRLWSVRAGAEIVLPVVEGWRQPWAALYRTALAERARALLETGETRPGRLWGRSMVHECAFTTADDLVAWQNLNTPEDYARWRSE
jgi:molybdopterin-guanine dinucleotide biosynthesis protein A